ncbi:MAG: S8 family serine peptidase [Dehalococcoidia bacterium]
MSVRLALFAAVAAASILVTEPSAPASDVRFVLGLEPSTSTTMATENLQRSHFTVTRVFDDLHAIEVAASAGDLETLAAIDGIRYAERVSRVISADQPTDPLYSLQSSYLQRVSAPAAWDIEKGKPSVIVAVVDTGVDVQHPDLRTNIWLNQREVPNNGRDDDNNGCVDDINGCAFVSDGSPGCQNITNGFVHDDIGHGTFVAGVIGAAGNGQGMIGVARGVRIMPVKVLDCYGSGDSIAAARGILYAARNGAKVINLSLGGFERAEVMRGAIIEAMNVHGAIVIAASGNSGGPGVAFPAAFPEALAVGAANVGGDGRAAFSSYGPEIDVVAVGEGIVGTIGANKCGVIIPCMSGQPYGSSAGTSFSTPQVSGLAALIYSLNPGLNGFQVADIIRNSATPLIPGSAPNWAGAGRINMLAALASVREGRPPGEACVIAQVHDGDSFSCSGGRQVRMLQMDAPDLGQCGGQWALDALRYIFLTPGRTVYLRSDVTRGDAQGRTLAAPLWRGNDGVDYNIAVLMVYVGLAKAADVGANNTTFRDWAFASQTWAQAARWNMWAPAKPFTGGC